MPNPMYKHQMPTEVLKDEIVALREQLREMTKERDQYRKWYDEAMERNASLVREHEGC